MHLIETMDTLLPNEDSEAGKTVEREFKKKGIRTYLKAMVTESNVTKSGVGLKLESKKNEVLNVEKVLSSVGRVPDTDALNLEAVGLAAERGFVPVDETFQSAKTHIYAIGDAIATEAYAHTAYQEARIVAVNIAQGKSHANHSFSPNVTFCHPQVGSVGVQEKQAKEQGIEVNVQKIFMKTSGKAKVYGDDSGFVKILAEKESDVILGATVVGAYATEIIHELALAVHGKMTVDQVAHMVHAHPTVSETVGALAHGMV